MEQYKVCIGPNLTCMNDLMNRMGQFDKVDYNGVQVKCRSSCEDQINSLFVTTSSYPNRRVNFLLPSDFSGAGLGSRRRRRRQRISREAGRPEGTETKDEKIFLPAPSLPLFFSLFGRLTFTPPFRPPSC